jgi:hypothetical protein
MKQGKVFTVYKFKKSVAPFAILGVASLALLGAAPAASAAPGGSIGNTNSINATSYENHAEAMQSRTIFEVEGSGRARDLSLSIDAQGNSRRASGWATFRLDGERTIRGEVNCLDGEGRDTVVATGTYELRGNNRRVGVFVAVVADNGNQQGSGRNRDADRIGADSLGTVRKGTNLRGLCARLDVREGGLDRVLRGDFEVDVHR